MGFKQKISKAMMTKVGPSRIMGMIAKQKSLSSQHNMLLPTSSSPTRFEISIEMINLLKARNDIEIRQVFPVRRMLSIMKNINISVDSLSENPSIPKTSASVEFLEQLKEFANSLSVGPFEFVKLPRDLIFQEFGVVYDNAIIIAMEMSQEKIDKAPSQETINMIFGTYDELGIAANKIAEFLREKGYGAQADHPLGGLVLFPPLAQQAGIGWVGKHGLLITPEFGPRVRLAAVYTSIQNLPFSETNDQHGWIDEYCKLCGICVKQCPPQAILEEAVTYDTGRITNITQQACFEYFTQFYGCSVCVKVCPFSKGDDSYERLKAAIEKRR